ncbi:MAG: hypothetical protein IK100_00230 [Muribaculaceae bacterium]|nr:hypothetical protein [Muribaculaceae bacterium]
MNINQYLHIVEKAISWQSNVPDSERQNYLEQLVNLRRAFKKIQFAADERCSTAAFGESQMGKSYLVSALMSDPGKPFTVTDGRREYNFIDEINPSNPNSRVEATGVVTRFTSNTDPAVPEGYLKARLLSVADIILVLCEAYHTQTDYDNSEIKKIDYIRQYCDSVDVSSVPNSSPILTQDDVMDIYDYLRNSTMKQRVANLTDPESGLFSFLLFNVNRLTDDQLLSAIKLLWFDNSSINRLFDTLIAAYRSIRFNSTVYVPFDAVLKKHGTLLDVARLDEIFDESEIELPDYRPTTIVTTQQNMSIEMRKGELSALVAELYMSLPNLESETRNFLSCLDILDFPGERRPENMASEKITNGKNLSVVLRRGKVTYLFNRYSDTKRISSLMLCHNNMQSAESKMGIVLEQWVNNNVGANAAQRDTFMRDTEISPLFIISTFFNLDLEYQTNDSPAKLEELRRRWDNRFKIVLEKEVLRANTDEDQTHWFNQWTTGHPFRSIFMLRDFKYSTKSFTGYNPNTKSPEIEEIIPAAFPNFMQCLKDSFVNYDFVQQHFVDANQAWESAATLNNDGTKPIIAALNQLAPRVKQARDNMFGTEITRLVATLKSLLTKYYHSGSADEEIRKAKRQAAQANLQLGKIEGTDPAAFGKMLDIMMIDEPHLYEKIHNALNNTVTTTSQPDSEKALFMRFGLSTDSSRAQNLDKLCDQLGVDTEEECAQMLSAEGIDINKLLNASRMVNSQAEQVASIVEKYWIEEYLTQYVVPKCKDDIPAVSDMTTNLIRLYRFLGMHDRITKRIDQFITTFDKDSAVAIIADYLAMEFNHFVTTFGFDYIDSKHLDNIFEKNARLKLNISEEMLSTHNELTGVKLLEELDQVNRRLREKGYNPNDRKALSRLPRYGFEWTWIEYLKVGYILSCDLPDYDIAANKRLGEIINEIDAN